MFQTNPSPTHEISLVSYSDVDWEGDIIDRRSIYGHYLMLNGNLIVWSSKNQTVVSRSSVEAEFRAVANVVFEILLVKSLLIEMGLHLPSTPII